jgi:hypothetical protein
VQTYWLFACEKLKTVLDFFSKPTKREMSGFDRVYRHYVFMLRNKDDDYSVPPTVVASTTDIEEAIEILLDAEQQVYSANKIATLRKMKVGEMYIINEDVVVWFTESRRRRIIIWCLRQYLNKCVVDEFMNVWIAYRKYIDYVDHGLENDMALTDDERSTLVAHVPYNKYLLRHIIRDDELGSELDIDSEVDLGREIDIDELPIADMDALYGDDEDYVNTHSHPIEDDDDIYNDGFVRVYSEMSPDQAVCGKRSIATRRAMEEEADEELSRALKNVRFSTGHGGLEIDDL